jgi:hypothetical protein
MMPKIAEDEERPNIEQQLYHRKNSQQHDIKVKWKTVIFIISR